MDSLLRVDETVPVEPEVNQVSRKYGFRDWCVVFAFSMLPLLLGFFWGSEVGPSWNLLLGSFVVVVVLLGFFFAFNWLFVWNVSTRVSPVSARWYWYLAVLLSVAQLNMGIAGVWDEVWHVTYSLPFGPDFLWRPHMLLYFGFGVQILVGFCVLAYITFWGRGNFRQRLQADPLFGLFLLLVMYVMMMLPADPIWHEIYRNDLSVWSIPHIVLFFGGQIFSFVCYGALELAFQAFRRSGETNKGFLGTVSWVFRMLILIMFSYSAFFQVLDFTPGMGSGAKPVWVLPMVGLLLAYGLSQVAKHIMDSIYIGAFAALLAFALRYLLYGYFSGFASLNQEILFWRGLVILLPLLLLVSFDWIYGLFAGRSAQDNQFLRMSLVSLVFLVCLPFYALVFSLNFFSFEVLGFVLLLPLLLTFDHVLKVIFSFLSSILDFSSTSHPLGLFDTVLPLAILIANLLFLLYFVLTAVSPAV